MCNSDIRIKAKESGVYMWQIAAKLNICDMTLVRKLRHELSDEEKAKIFAIIEELAANN